VPPRNRLNVSVAAQGGSASQSAFDHDDVRRVRVESDATGSHTTLFIDDWSEVRDGKLVRYVAHGGRRIVRLADGNGASPAAGDAHGCGTAPERGRRMPIDATRWFLSATLLLSLLHRYRRRLLAAARVLAPLACLLALSALSNVGCSHNATTPQDVEAGTVLSMGDQDELLFEDALGSLTETTSGGGNGLSSSATFPYGLSRFDSSRETRKFANTPRDTGVGVDVMGVRAYVPELGVWSSPDPVGLHAPERGIGTHPGDENAYAYAAGRPTTLVDRDGNWAVGPIVLGVSVVVGVVFTCQYANAPSPTDVLYHKNVGEMALDMAHNSAMVYGTVTAVGSTGSAIAAAPSVAAKVWTGVKVVAGAYVGSGAIGVVGDIADKYDPSGETRKVIETGVGFAAGAKVPKGAAGARVGIGAGAEEGATGARAKEIHGTLNPVTQRKTTTAVITTKEGTNVVASSEKRLRPAQRAALKPGECEGTGCGHAEVTGVKAAKAKGLTPTTAAASRPICPACAEFLKQNGVEPASPLK
jgi:RHS repeat-associated protein